MTSSDSLRLPEAVRGNPRVAAYLDGYRQRYHQLLAEHPELAPKEGAENVACPCCGSEFSAFGRFRHHSWDPWRQNAMCHVCGSLERHRRLWLQLVTEDALFEEQGALLHIAPEPFLSGFFKVCSNLEYVDVDLQEGRAGQNFDVTRLPFAESRFNWLLCSHVLEHVDDDHRALAEFYRVLLPGGVAWQMVPTLKEGTLVHEPPPGGFTPDDHRREYGLEDFVERAQGAGFRVEVLHAKSLSAAIRKRFRTSNHVYRCTKP